jgi:hypothetical protein
MYIEESSTLTSILMFMLTYPKLAHCVSSRYNSTLSDLKVTQILSRRNLHNKSIWRAKPYFNITSKDNYC